MITIKKNVDIQHIALGQYKYLAVFAVNLS